MKTLRRDHRFTRRYILRSAILVVPPLVAGVLVWRAWDRSDSAIWLAAIFFLAWIVVWIISDAVMFRTYRCPSCGQRIRHPTIRSRGAGDPIRYYCSKCDIEWDTGLRESSD
jgi:predicted RNA-binding Zn-ribbon protein involved in translation (DUF1610 family)